MVFVFHFNNIWIKPGISTICGTYTGLGTRFSGSIFILYFCWQKATSYLETLGMELDVLPVNLYFQYKSIFETADWARPQKMMPNSSISGHKNWGKVN